MLTLEQRIVSLETKLRRERKEREDLSQVLNTIITTVVFPLATRVSHLEDRLTKPSQSEAYTPPGPRMEYETEQHNSGNE